MRRTALLTGITTLAVLLHVAAGHAADPTPFGHACTRENGVRFCPARGLSERVPSFDGVPLDVDVTLPRNGDGPFPAIAMVTGFGADKTSLEATNPGALGNWNNVFYARRGYAVINASPRGFGASCGSLASRTPACARGWTHLSDQRYEVRDVQWLLGKLVDEGTAKADALGVTGWGSGGAQVVQLAALRDRVRALDGTLDRWTSPRGTRLAIRAAFARSPWSNVLSTLLPNGRFVDFREPDLDEDRQPVGILKQSFTGGFMALGLATGYLAPTGADPQADPLAWLTRVELGEPYGADAERIARALSAYRHPFGLGGVPAPLLLQGGWTNDLLTPLEVLRIYNAFRARDAHADVALQFADQGDARGSNNQGELVELHEQAASLFDFHLKRMPGAAPPRRGSVTAFPQRCPPRPSSGPPFKAASWAALHPGAVRLSSARVQVVTSDGGDALTAIAFDPIAGGGDACRTVPAERAPGTAVYEVPISEPFTLLGLPTVTVTVETHGSGGQLDSRLWDMSPDGRQRLVSRGAYRLTDHQRGRITFQLNGNCYRFERGHRAKLELLGGDTPYLRPSNGKFRVALSDVSVEFPTAERRNGRQIVAPTDRHAAG
jgi:hypothetical protein